MEKLLITEDSEEIRTQLAWGVGTDYAVLPAGDAREAVALFKKHLPRVATLDLGLPPDADGTGEGFRCLQEMLKHDPTVKVIVITGNDQRENALRAVQMGAYDYYQKPINLDELKVIIKRAFHLSAIERENVLLQGATEGRAKRIGGMIGVCDSMHQVFSLVHKVAPSEAAVLVQGESGTGKELIARAIHDHSPRRNGPFVAINCGAIPEALLESELFGHEKGAFTGAHAQVQGKVEYAQNGSLFLDEIGELPALLQVKLLRFLQNKTIQRVGGREDVPINTRIIAATNRDLIRQIAAKKFREDLYYRLGVVMIKVPPLRERTGDLTVLAGFFLKRYAEQYDKRVRAFSAAAAESMEQYDWPGNVRELENRIQRAVILCDKPLLEPGDLGFEEKSEQAGTKDGRGLKAARERLEKEMVACALDQHRGNVARAAQELSISRPTMYDLMKKHGLGNIGHREQQDQASPE